MYQWIASFILSNWGGKIGLILGVVGTLLIEFFAIMTGGLDGVLIMTLLLAVVGPIATLVLGIVGAIIGIIVKFIVEKVRSR